MPHTNVVKAEAESEKLLFFETKANQKSRPYRYEELKNYFDTGVIHSETRCWTQWDDNSRPPHSITQFKWTQLAAGEAVISEKDLAYLIHDMLIRMAEHYPSRDVHHAIVWTLLTIK